jgi:hypothetical protein
VGRGYLFPSHLHQSGDDLDVNQPAAREGLGKQRLGVSRYAKYFRAALLM